MLFSNYHFTLYQTLFPSLLKTLTLKPLCFTNQKQLVSHSSSRTNSKSNPLTICGTIL